MNKVHKPLYFYLMLFFSTTIIGALLLYLPFTGKKPISFLDALFIASSAFTVTGLSPVDIGSQFNILGEIVILFINSNRWSGYRDRNPIDTSIFK